MTKGLSGLKNFSQESSRQTAAGRTKTVMQAHLFSGVFTKVTHAQSRPQIPERRHWGNLVIARDSENANIWQGARN